jgi:hypothetical protein
VDANLPRLIITQDMIEDYVERNQDSFEEFVDSVTDLYESLNLDALSAALYVASRRRLCSHRPVCAY